MTNNLRCLKGDKPIIFGYLDDDEGKFIPMLTNPWRLLDDDVAFAVVALSLEKPHPGNPIMEEAAQEC